MFCVTDCDSEQMRLMRWTHCRAIVGLGGPLFTTKSGPSQTSFGKPKVVNKRQIMKGNTRSNLCFSQKVLLHVYYFNRNERKGDKSEFPYSGPYTAIGVCAKRFMAWLQKGERNETQLYNCFYHKQNPLDKKFFIRNVHVEPLSKHLHGTKYTAT